MADPAVVEMMRNEGIDMGLQSMYDELDLPEDALAMLKQSPQFLDPVQSYIDASNEIARKGNHDEVIEILRNYEQ